MSMAEEDLVEEQLPHDHLAPDERDPEAPPEDALEQATPVDRSTQPVVVRRGLEVNEYDAVEQARIVELDDDYR